ncbi:MAG: hypothetical protein M3O64_01770 [Chloroflexota bacterium]|nr:hypothetical protein [Chloroflexota bacterium]
MALVRRSFVALVCAIAIGSLAADLWFRDLFDPPGIFVTLPLLSFAIVGSLLVLRRAGGPIGWLLAATGALLQLVAPSQAYGYASLDAGAALPGGELVLWLGSFIGSALLLLLIPAMVLFPDGHHPSRTVAILLGFGVAAGFIFTVASALADQPILVPLPYLGLHTGEGARAIPNPFAQHGPLGDLLLLTASALNNLAPPLLLVAPLALAVRFRRSQSVERQQLKWLMYAAGITFGLMVIGYVFSLGPIKILVNILTVFGLGLLPVAIGIAVTRYRLYDIDVLIRRTLIYVALSAMLLAAYVGGVALFQFVLAPVTAGNGVAVAISTLAVVTLFQPLRRRVQRTVDRRFYRSRYDAVRTVDSFAVRLRDEVDLDAVRADLLGSVQQTMAPAHMSLWLRERAR